ncbi:MAG: polysaccharide deacetylase [Clostridia bacterium]|nr:polysaccharide deacetylase [Clostridia bacterium]
MNRNYHTYCAILLAFALILVMCSQFFKDNASFADARTEKAVYLTFDDGPSDRVTPKILDVLKEENVKATFFIVGSAAENRKYLIEREVNEGHTVAVHSYSHRYGEIYSSTENLLNDIDKCNKLIKSVTGNYSDVYRFPGGSYGLSDKLVSAVKERGIKYVDWNASVRDAEYYSAPPEILYQSAVDTSKGHDTVILLAHDSTTKTTTAEALKKIIKYFKSQNFVFKKF